RSTGCAVLHAVRDTLPLLPIALHHAQLCTPGDDMKKGGREERRGEERRGGQMGTRERRIAVKKRKRDRGTWKRKTEAGERAEYHSCIERVKKRQINEKKVVKKRQINDKV